MTKSITLNREEAINLDLRFPSNLIQYAQSVLGGECFMAKWVDNNTLVIQAISEEEFTRLYGHIDQKEPIAVYRRSLRVKER